MLGSKRLLMVLIICSVIPGAMAGEKQLISDQTYSVCSNEFRTMSEEWIIHFDQYTSFFDTENQIYLTINDLLPGMFAIVDGWPCQHEMGFCAMNVLIGSRINSMTHPSGGGHGESPLIGEIVSLDLPDGSFKLLVDGYQNEMMQVLAFDDTRYYQAWSQGPITEINFWELFPGSPVMIHGFFQGDVIHAEAVIVTNDWEISYNMRDDDSGVELYGYIEDTRFLPGSPLVIIVNVVRINHEGDTEVFQTYVPVSGGSVSFPFGFLHFPPGALSEGQFISIEGSFKFWSTIRNSYTFSPEGLVFNVPVELELKYYNLEGTNPDLLNLCYYDEETGKWRIAVNMTHYPNEHCFRGDIEHFSRYSLSTNGRPLQQQINSNE